MRKIIEVKNISRKVLIRELHAPFHSPEYSIIYAGTISKSLESFPTEQEIELYCNGVDVERELFFDMLADILPKDLLEYVSEKLEERND